MRPESADGRHEEITEPSLTNLLGISPDAMLDHLTTRLIRWQFIWASIAMLFPLYRGFLGEWIAAFYLHALVWLATFVAFLLRDRSSYRHKSWVLVSAHIAVGFVSLKVAGVNTVVSGCISLGLVLCSMTLGWRSMVKMLIVVAATYLLVSHLFVSGQITQNIDRDSKDAIEWLALALAVGWPTAMITVALSAILDHYKKSYRDLLDRSFALRDSEKEYRELFEGAVDCLYRTDLQGYVTAMSPSAKDVLGWMPEQVIGKKLAEFYVDPGERLVLLQRLRDEPEKTHYFEAVLRTPDGEGKLIGTNVSFWRSANGDVQGLQGTARNIDAQRKAEELIRQTQKTELLGQVAGRVAHDINNLLMIITGNAEQLADKDAPNEQTASKARDIIAAAHTGSGLLKQVLRFSRPDPLRPTAVDANDTIRSMSDMLAASAAQNAELSYDLSEARCPLLVDEVQFQSTLVNLVVNASQAISSGGRIVIRTRVESAAEATETPILISVCDNGRGMTKSEASRATEPFFSTKPEGEGSGLGLSIIDTFARNSGGSLTIDSEPGVGTTVTLQLPSHIPEENPEETDSAPAASEDPGLHHARSILLIEDTDQLRRLLVRHLESKGYDVTAVSDGQQALECLGGEQTFDLILSDITMPGELSGLDVARFAQRQRTGQRVMFMTGYTPESLNADDPLAAFPILYKPFALSELDQKLRETLAAGSPSNEDDR